MLLARDVGERDLFPPGLGQTGHRELPGRVEVFLDLNEDSNFGTAAHIK
jgi:hypothetical protein